MPKIAIFYATAGEGHRKVAEAIRDELSATLDHNVQIKCEDVLAYTNILFKKSYPSVYHYLVTKLPDLWGWVYDFFDQHEVFWFWRFFRRIFNGFHAAPLEKYLAKEQFDVVISTHFLSAEVASVLKMKKKISSIVLDRKSVV